MARRICCLFQRSVTWAHYIELDTRKLLLFPRTRLIASLPVKKTLPETPVYKKTDHEHKITKKMALKTLENLLGIQTFTALEILLKNKDIMKVTSALMRNNYTLYLKNCITNDTLVKYPLLLTVRNINSKLTEIQKLPYNINTIASLLLLPENILQKFVDDEVQQGKEFGRIATISELLQISEEKACEFISKKIFFCSLPMERMKENITTLGHFGISLQDIYNDLWVLRYNTETIKSKLAEAKTCKVDVIKTWMVRVQPEIFQNYVKRRSDNKSILGDNSLAEYLSERLECSVEVANYLILKQPALKNKSLRKLKELIDFLYAADFKSHHICRVPKILVHSVETIQKRLKQLEDKNIKLDSLHMLTKSQKQFTQYYEALIKNKLKVKS